MKRREFIRKIGLGLAAGWAGSRLSWPLTAQAAAPGLRLALLSDAHLRDGDPTRPEARALARAVAEIHALSPPPQLVLFAGDLAHQGSPQALELGREILSHLPAPVLMVMGEGDGRPERAGAWQGLFGKPGFSESVWGTYFIGLHTAWRDGPAGPAFYLGEAQRRWLARELAPRDSETPLILLSHAPLIRIFRPWQQWTADAHLAAPLLARFRRVICLHGHVHGPGLSENIDASTRRQVHYLGLPATSWPLPQAIQGTPAALHPEPGSRGCGWGLLAVNAHTFRIQPQVWQV